MARMLVCWYAVILQLLLVSTPSSSAWPLSANHRHAHRHRVGGRPALHLSERQFFFGSLRASNAQTGDKDDDSSTENAVAAVCQDTTTSTDAPSTDPLDEPARRRRRRQASLQFVAHTRLASDPLPFPKSVRLDTFVGDPQNYKHLLLGHGPPNRNNERRNMTSKPRPSVDPWPSTAGIDAVDFQTPYNHDELLGHWRDEAQRLGALPPDERTGNPNESLALVRSSKIPFLMGVWLLVDSIISVKFVPSVVHMGDNEEDASFPCLEFVLLRDTPRVQGPSAWVWVHQQLTGGKGGIKKNVSDEKNNKNDDNLQLKEQSTRSWSRLTVLPLPDDDNSFVFCSESQIEINVRFPALLLKLLPLSIEACNAQGSAAMQRTFDEKGAASLNNFSKASRNWWEQQHD